MSKFESREAFRKAINDCLDAGVKPEELVYSLSDTFFDERSRWESEHPSHALCQPARRLKEAGL